MVEVMNSVIPSLVENGVFGEFKFVELISNDENEVGNQFASDLAFINLVVEGSSGEKVFPLVVKVPLTDPEERKARNVDAMFHNEVTMYKEILPSLGYEETRFPKMYYGIASSGLNPESDIVILENLKHKGFVPSKQKVFLDFYHISLALKKLAEFHSLSYKLKHENREKFDQIVRRLKEVNYSESVELESDAMKAAGMIRGIEAVLQDNNKTVDLLEKCLQVFKRPSKLMQLISLPEEPFFAVICHGDFCNNNVLFKYSESDEPIDCVLFDFQLVQYSNPVTDLMFFLYMHTTSDMREKHWDEFLKLYWDTLRKNVPIQIPSFEEYLEHIGKRALYGYIISSWWLPMMMFNEDGGSISNELRALDYEGKINFFRTVGGEEGDKVVCEMVSHLLEKNYILNFFYYCDEKKFQC